MVPKKCVPTFPLIHKRYLYFDKEIKSFAYSEERDEKNQNKKD